ncbi:MULTISPECIES: hypothetical protein [unclassified Methylobacterium]|uniref:hypothetical protein n=1 Tax=unclassified Methylobacterium TaxID=2615210 RepID=UPI000ADD9E29|nr:MULTISPECIES: hypothetical protein [unclassified Methylobacterium]
MSEPAAGLAPAAGREAGGACPEHPSRSTTEAEMNEFDGDTPSEFDHWKNTALAYGLIAIGTCIVIYGIVGQ